MSVLSQSGSAESESAESDRWVPELVHKDKK